MGQVGEAAIDQGACNEDLRFVDEVHPNEWA